MRREFDLCVVVFVGKDDRKKFSDNTPMLYYSIASCNRKKGCL